MLGAIAGDVIGSVYEEFPIKTKHFPLFGEYSTFTDDTVLTVAVAHAILNNENYGNTIKSFGQRYPDAGYGMSFYEWMFSPSMEPYNSWGNGSAMRVSSIGFLFDSVDSVLLEAKKSAEVTHNHPEGVKGAQATALAVYLARTGASKDTIRSEMQKRFGYWMDRTLREIRPEYNFTVSCQGSVPEAIIAFLESRDFESAIRNAISLGGDSDTMASIAGGIAQAFYGGVPDDIRQKVISCLPKEFEKVLYAFEDRIK
ncbi:MAG: hypothetical protein COB67_09655 [SAR324 cluster bacterium]|uniref:ADP-ribosylglycohydrolase family protein n=1 Tax=SAR324 cluster bacterium TaxID=2024889 RepID=A0A2A4SZW9_9DELT|nr:MAG: hypothetical protein COB67_09655 [SAR324 cluster bacterium]